MTARRKWFQIHLLTVVPVMLVAGILLWANLTPVTGLPKVDLDYMGENRPVQTWKYGWPAVVAERKVSFSYIETDSLGRESQYMGGRTRWAIYWGTGLPVCVVAGLGILLVVGLASQRVFHARKGGKGGARRLHIHLSTLIIATLVAAILLGANMGQYPRELTTDFDTMWIKYVRGWPIHFQVANSPLQYHRLTLNVTVLCAFVISVGLCCEWFIRHRRRPQQAHGEELK